MEKVNGYKIQKTRIFETGHGFALASGNGAFMVFQFTQTPFGRDFYHGHSFDCQDEAEQDFCRRADGYREIYRVQEKTGHSTERFYRYYSTQRPVDIGTYPKPDGNIPLVIVNYDCDMRRPVEEGRLCAWGELTYQNPLTKAQADAYELAAASAQETG